MSDYKLPQGKVIVHHIDGMYIKDISGDIKFVNNGRKGEWLKQNDKSKIKNKSFA